MAVRDRRTLGKEKELLAAEWMKGHGYEILEMNYRCRQGEVDIVAKDGAYLVFVEVKYRRDAGAGYPAEAVVAQQTAADFLCRPALYDAAWHKRGHAGTF